MTIISLIIGLVVVLIGILIGQRLSDKREHQKAAEDLDKLQYLINADFSAINKINQRAIEYIPKFEKNIDGIVINLLKSSTAEHFQNHLNNLSLILIDFTYWDSIMSYGILFRLSGHDLKFITAVHTLISEMIPNQTKDFMTFTKSLSTLYFSNVFDSSKIPAIKLELEAYLCLMKNSHNSIQESITHLKNNVSWIDLNVEPIQEFKFGPPKMKVDHKGTYTIE